MNTVLLLAIFIIALYILARVEAGRTQTRRRAYYAVTAVRATQQDSALEDVEYLWRLLSARQNASRRAVVRSHEMSAWRWSKANAVIKHLQLDPARMSYEEGVERIHRYVQDQERLGRFDTYVPPVDWRQD